VSRTGSISIGEPEGGVEELPKRVRNILDAYGPGDYHTAYTHLLRAAKILASDKTPSGYLGIAAAAYAWMPTILRRWPTEDELAALTEWALDVKDTSDAAKGIAAGKAPALQSVNNSLVGTSKFLHFLRPEVFPIWDSVVASHWTSKRPEYELPEAYAQYLELIDRIVSSESIAALRTLLHPDTDEVDDVRSAEYALFLTSPVWKARLTRAKNEQVKGGGGSEA
jgi:hypothetical protein